MAASIAAESAAGAIAESAIASISSNQDSASNRVAIRSRLAEGSALATASGKYRPTASTLGTMIPPQALGVSIPGDSTKRQIGIERKVSRQRAPRRSRLPAIAACRQRSQASLNDVGMRRAMKSPVPGILPYQPAEKLSCGALPAVIIFSCRLAHRRGHAAG